MSSSGINQTRLNQQLARLGTDPGPISIFKVIEVCKENTFAVLILLLMAIPALPLPTGGITHLFEIVAILLAIELILGRQTVWLPKRLGRLTLKPETIGMISKWVLRFEKYSKPRLANLLQHQYIIRVLGLNLLLFISFAFLAPIFSGLDTLPSLGAVILAFGILLDDISLVLFGQLVGTAGIILILVLGRAVLKLV